MDVNEITVEETTEEKQVETTYTQAELDSHISKAVDAAIERQAKKVEKEKENLRKQVAEEERKKAQMTAEERAKADLEAREKAIADREAEIEKKEFTADVMAELTEQGLPLSFAELIVSSSTRDTADELIQKLKADWEGALKEQNKALARQPDPKSSETTPSGESFNLADFARQNRKI